MLMKKGTKLLLMVVLMVSVTVLLGGVVYAAGTSIKTASITISSLTYNGKVQKPKIEVKIGETILVEGKDYTLTFSNNASINQGTYHVTIEGIGDYTGKENLKYEIKPKKITPSVTLSAKSFVYNGEVQKPTVKAVKDGTTVLPDSEYSVNYESFGKDVGPYTITVEMKDNYIGSKKVTYKINPKGTSLKTPKRGSKLIKLKWTKQSALMSQTRITGYEIQLATNSKFTKGKKTVTVKGYSKYSKKVTKLKGGKKYYIRIRTYKTVNGVKCCSKWSKNKTATTKR